MKKLVLILLLSLSLTGCVKGNEIKTEKTDYSIIMNDGSVFVFTFKDPVTNVWYMATNRGITPRLNSNGTLYVKEK